MFLGLGCACLLAFGFATAPRLFLLLAWIVNPIWWQVVWSKWANPSWLWPLLGIIFLPYTTIMYMLSWNLQDGISGFAWIWVIMGVILDLMQWGSAYERRQEIPVISGYTEHI